MFDKLRIYTERSRSGKNSMLINKKLVSIITATYNGIIFLKPWLASLQKQTYRAFEVIVVDNDSSDGTVEYLKKNFPQVKIIKNKTNNGFAKANNQGAILAKGEYLLFVNNDTELFPKSVENLINTYQPKSILTAYQIPSRDKKIQGRVGAGMDIFGYAYTDQKDFHRTKLFYADGAALFLKKKDFIDLGKFDEKLFMFQEDVDLSWRAQILGFKIISVWNAKLYHYYGGTAVLEYDEKKQYVSSYFRRYLNERNVIRNLIKNYSLPWLILILVCLLFFHLAEIVLFLFTGNLKIVKCYFAAYWWNIRNLRSTLKIRDDVQSKRIVSDRVLLKRMYWNYSKLRMFLKLGFPKFR